MNEILKRKKVAVLVGGQWGSEGKGAIAGWLALGGIENAPFDFAATNAGAQAGHTTTFADGRKMVCHHLPTTAVIQRIPAYLTAGSVIDVDTLLKEIDRLKFPTDLVRIHPNAAVISYEDVMEEQDASSPQTRISSTQRGVGAALARKIRRGAEVAKNCPALMGMISSPDVLFDTLRCGALGMLEVPQGFGLGLNHGGHYPHCTSRDCYVTSAMADAGLHPSYLGTVIMVVRAFPIRVGNILGGFSGPPMPDNKEITFEELGQPPEYTTTTGRQRRIFTFSFEQYRRALIYNRPDIVVLTFCNYFKSADEFTSLRGNMRQVENELGIHPQIFYEYGPTVKDVTESYYEIISTIEAHHAA